MLGNVQPRRDSLTEFSRRYFALMVLHRDTISVLPSARGIKQFKEQLSSLVR
jgi:hypothetical protein